MGGSKVITFHHSGREGNSCWENEYSSWMQAVQPVNTWARKNTRLELHCCEWREQRHALVLLSGAAAAWIAFYGWLINWPWLISKQVLLLHLYTSRSHSPSDCIVSCRLRKTPCNGCERFTLSNGRSSDQKQLFVDRPKFTKKNAWQQSLDNCIGPTYGNWLTLKAARWWRGKLRKHNRCCMKWMSLTSSSRLLLLFLYG